MLRTQILVILSLVLYVTAAPSGCPPGVPMVNCFVDPCTTATCPGVPGAQCKADYCGGCNTKWFLGGRDVTRYCQQSNPSDNCGAGEEYLTCGSACPPQCGDELMGRACIMMCKAGCFCKQGLVRGPNNRCIRREQCPSNLSTCAVILCVQGTHCEANSQGARCVADTPGITCANVRCAGRCVDTRNGPRCYPREPTTVAESG